MGSSSSTSPLPENVALWISFIVRLVGKTLVTAANAYSAATWIQIFSGDGPWTG
jgi:hypothetical protein